MAKFKVPEGLTLKQYAKPEEAGWFGWLEDKDGKLAGYLKAEDSDDLVTVEQAEADLAAEATAAAKAKAKKGGKGRKRVETNEGGSDKPKKGSRPTLHQLNAIRRLSEKATRDERKTFRNPEEAARCSKAAHTTARRLVQEANAEVKRILADAEGTAADLIAAAKADAEAIRKGAKAEAGSSS